MKKFRIITLGLIFMILSACGKETKESNKMEDIYQESDEIENSIYQVFYGEWEMTDCVYLDKIPVRGIEYTEEEMEQAGRDIIEHAWKKIQFTQNTIVINDSENWKEAKYDMVVFPADDEYMLHFTMQLKDIGLTEDKGEYYVFVEARGKEGDKISFFIKDQNTLVIYKGSYCIQYKRVSNEGEKQNIVIIQG